MTSKRSLNDIGQEPRIQMAIQAIKSGQIKSERTAATIFDISRTTLRRRLKGTPTRAESQTATLRLTQIEELVIVDYILDLVSRGFPPDARLVEDMANNILRERDQPPVGKNWTFNFIKRTTKLTTRFS
jgi:hypothetical protein